jgi:hypothetical protein
MLLVKLVSALNQTVKTIKYQFTDFSNLTTAGHGKKVELRKSSYPYLAKKDYPDSSLHQEPH